MLESGVKRRKDAMKKFPIFFAVGLCVSTALADELVVPTQFPTIQKAVDAAKTEWKEDTEPLKEYGFGEIMKSSTEYFGGDELAASV